MVSSVQTSTTSKSLLSDFTPSCLQIVRSARKITFLAITIWAFCSFQPAEAYFGNIGYNVCMLGCITGSTISRIANLNLESLFEACYEGCSNIRPQ
jgi:hypothetical protein